MFFVCVSTLKSRINLFYTTVNTRSQQVAFVLSELRCLHFCLCRSRSHQSPASYVNTACVFGLPLVPFKPGLTLILQFTLACIKSPASLVNITCVFGLRFPYIPRPNFHTTLSSRSHQVACVIYEYCLRS